MENELSIIELIRKGGYLLILICVLGECIFFFSLPNLLGCLMCFLSWWTFSHFLKEQIILNHPFAWLFYLSMVLYRYLPLIATFFDGKPITYGFEMPYETFLGEILLFFVQTLAFYHVVYYGFSFSKLKNFLRKISFFDYFTAKSIWIMGLIGIIAFFLVRDMGEVQFGDVGGKFLAPLSAMRLIPIVLFFPSLCPIEGKTASKRVLWLYLIFLEILSLSGNSREHLIYPIGTYFILYFLQLVKQRENISAFVYSARFPLFVILFVVLINLLSVASNSMLLNRSIRKDVTSSELLEHQLKSFGDKKQQAEERFSSYNMGWDETYVDNFMLNRYCNMRITDETLYYADKLPGTYELGNPMMREFFLDRLLANFPLPIMKILSINIDKRNLDFSEGDYLVAISSNSVLVSGYRVASHLGLGLATFGLLYFPIQYVLLIILFCLFDTLVDIENGRIIYSLAGLAVVFEMVGRFRNATGCVSDVGFIQRDYWQNLFLYWITFKVSTFSRR